MNKQKIQVISNNREKMEEKEINIKLVGKRLNSYGK